MKSWNAFNESDTEYYFSMLESVQIWGTILETCTLASGRIADVCAEGLDVQGETTSRERTPSKQNLGSGFGMKALQENGRTHYHRANHVP